MEPGFEAIGLAQVSEVAPGCHESGLDGLIREIDVAQDPERDRHASIADHAGQGAEGLVVALSRAGHQRSLHPSLLPSIGSDELDRTREPSAGRKGSICARGPPAGPIQSLPWQPPVAVVRRRGRAARSHRTGGSHGQSG
jgi:hypothetical protein